METALHLWLLLVAPAVGSFLALYADRIRDGRDPVRAPSRCGACQTRLPPRDLVPILSFLWLRGRCRFCDTPIPVRSFWTELAALALAAWVLLQGAEGWLAVAQAFALWALLGLALCDWLAWRLPDPLTGGLFLAAMAMAALASGRDAVDAAIWGAGAALVFWLIALIYRAVRGRDGLGLGDVKMAAGLGAIFGAALPAVVLIAALLGLVHGSVAARMQGVGLSGLRPVPFGLCLAVAAILYWTASPPPG